MLPRWTGTCGALATRCPSPSKTAQEKSSRSLMFTDCAVARSASPISSAIPMKMLPNTSRRTGSASVPAVSCGFSCSLCFALTRVSTRSLRVVSSADQPGSTTMVWFASTMMAGPATVWPGARSSRCQMSASCQAPCEKKRVRETGSAGFPSVRSGASAVSSPPASASTSTTAMKTRFSGETKPKRCA